MPAALPSAAHVVRPPARRARIIALLFSIVAVGFSIVFGVYARHTFALFDRDHPDRFIEPATYALGFLLFAMLFRMAAAICELIWLARTWTNLPEELRKVGPVDKVTASLAVGLSFVPGIAWVWKLGLVMAVADGFECVRTTIPFRAPVPKKLGLAAVLVAWIPGLNVYIAPFLWEMFATRIDVVCREILSAQTMPGVPATRAMPDAQLPPR